MQLLTLLKNPSYPALITPQRHFNARHGQLLGCSSEFPRMWILCKELVEKVRAFGGETAGDAHHSLLDFAEVAEEAKEAVGDAAEEDPAWYWGEEEEGEEC
jgi:hypothetical protein